MNVILTSIIIYILLCILIHSIKPSFMYNTDGSFKPFGIGYQKKTVIPIWLCMIILAILIYFFVYIYSVTV